MLTPTAGGKLSRRTYGDDLNRMLDDWARTWGASIPQGDTVASALDAYIGDLAQRLHRKEIAQSTVNDYHKHLGKVREVFGHIRLADIDVPMLVSWRDARGKVSATQFNHQRTVLMEALKIAIERGMVDTNPVAMLRPMRTRPRDRYVTNDEVNAVLSHSSAPVQAAIIIAISTGLRQGDILALKRSDFSDTGLTVIPSKTKGKSRKAMHFHWSPGLRLACELAKRKPERKDEDVKVTPIDGPWLTTRNGRAYTSDGFRTLWDRALKKARAADARLTGFTFHDLRAKAGTDSDDWQLLGHLDRKTHSRIYDRKPRVVRPAR